MIHFIKPDEAISTYKEKAIGNMIIPVSLDNMSGGDMFIKMTNMYPELPEVFAKTSEGKTYLPGYSVGLHMNNGDMLYLIIIKSVDKFQAYLLDIVTAIERTVTSLLKEGKDSKVMIPLISSQITKLSDNIVIPAVVQTCNVSDVDMYMVADSECTSLIESFDNGIVTWKPNTWKPDWMLQLDDVLLVDIIHEVNRLTHGFKLAKSKMMMIYEICHEEGMFPKIEFYESTYGKYFKMFMPKYMSLLNHGLLMNTHHYAKIVDGKATKSDLRIGYMFPHIKHTANKILLDNASLVQKVALKVRDKYLKQRKESYETYKKMQAEAKDNVSHTDNFNPFNS